MRRTIPMALLVAGTLALAGACTSKPVETEKKPAPPSPEMVAVGKELFVKNCSACHGPDAKGLPHLGKNLNQNAFVQSKTDPQLLTYVKSGRGISDPLNTTGVPMPPKGGNPALSDADIQKIIGFLRSIQS